MDIDEDNNEEFELEDDPEDFDACVSDLRGCEDVSAVVHEYTFWIVMSGNFAHPWLRP